VMLRDSVMEAILHLKRLWLCKLVQYTIKMEKEKLAYAVHSAGTALPGDRETVSSMNGKLLKFE
jgi:hypothetical protein